MTQTIAQILFMLLNCLPEDDQVQDVAHDPHAHDDEGHHVVRHEVDGGHGVAVVVVLGGVGDDDQEVFAASHLLAGGGQDEDVGVGQGHPRCDVSSAGWSIWLHSFVDIKTKVPSHYGL